ncbi:MAG: aldehyde dehydrogenase family protein, partial [Planctomycetota bacterium]
DGGLLLYVPAVERRDFLSAMAYLVRRLDENTAAGNFLRDLFGLAPGTPAWAAQRERFEAGWLARHDVAVGSRRVEPAVRPERAGTRLEDFRNEPDTDFTLAASRAAVDATHTRRTEPLPSLSPTDEVLAAAAAAGPAWEARGVAARAAILRDVATRLSADRFETIACLRDEGRKAIVEADAEVSEAIDFARYYAVAALADDATFAGLRSTPLGVVVVVPPWNFPYAIPAGGVLAALVAGNTVVLKPAPEARRIAWWLARQLWDAGVPRDVLYFHACDDDDQGRQLVTDGRTAAVVLTGAYATADLFRSWKPSLRLYAETSGKNAPRRHRPGRPGTGDQRPRAFRVRTQRTEVFGREPGDPRGRGLRRPRFP